MEKQEDGEGNKEGEIMKRKWGYYDMEIFRFTHVNWQVSELHHRYLMIMSQKKLMEQKIL